MLHPFSYLRGVDFNPRAPALRRDQTDEEKQLWRALRASRFAGFKFRRQRSLGSYIMDFYGPLVHVKRKTENQHFVPPPAGALKNRSA